MSAFVPAAGPWRCPDQDEEVDHASPPAWREVEVPGEAVAPAVLLEEHPSAPPSRTAAALDDGTLTALIARIERRDARALEALYQAAGARIYSFVHRFMRSHALTEEVVEDTFWQVWRQAPRFRLDRGRAMTWLLAMARSRAIDALRREQRFQCEPLATGDDDTRIDERAHDLLEAARGATRLHDALAALEPRARQLLALAFFRGLTHEEIAAHTTMPLGSVKSTIRRALLQLRAQLQSAPGTVPVGDAP